MSVKMDAGGPIYSSTSNINATMKFNYPTEVQGKVAKSLFITP